MPVECRSSRASASRRTARIPQWASEILTPKNRLSMPVRIGFPTYRLSHGIASRSTLPANRDPITRSSPAAKRSTNGASCDHRVGAVSVGHDDEIAAGMIEPGEVGAAVAPASLDNDACAVRGRDLGRAIARTVVDDDHFARSAAAVDPEPRLIDDVTDGILFVEARDDDRDLWGY